MQLLFQLFNFQTVVVIRRGFVSGNKQQATSNKQQATSNKQQATNKKCISHMFQLFQLFQLFQFDVC